MSAAVVERPDLAGRTNLSKSVLIGADLCGQKAWYELRARRPFIANERMTFGSAVDAGVELAIKALRSGQAISEEQIADAARFVAARDGIDIDIDDAARAVERWLLEVSPRYDFAYARTQETLRTVIDGLGECEGHPDVILRLAEGSHAIYDVKTSARAKAPDAAATSVELGFYDLLLADAGDRVVEVGYWTWVRKAKPEWQIVSAPMSDELRRRTRAVAMAYARARRADELLNAKAEEPRNYSFPSGPRSLGLCATCQYAPSNGGPCDFAATSAEDAA